MYGPRNFKEKFGGYFANYGRFVCVHDPATLLISRIGYDLYRKNKKSRAIWDRSHPNTVIVLLPRGREQRLRYEEMHLTNVLIPREVLDGPNLVYYSDFVIGAGGTINREATVLGTPVYTIFKGMLGSVGQNLIKSGKMVRIEDTSEFYKINYCKKKYLSYSSWSHGKGLVNEVVDKILEVAPIRERKR